ncbi:MAG TPA: hypothetical protein VGB41_05090 [Acidimicrobiia bacterium]
MDTLVLLKTGDWRLKTFKTQDRPRRLHVLGDLGHQLAHTGEPALVADPIDEPHPQLDVVEVLVEVEQVCLDHLGLAPEGRTYADVRHPRDRLGRRPPAPHRIHAAPRDGDPGWHRHVGRGDPDRPASSVAPDHGPPYLVGTDEGRRRPGDVAGGEHHPDPGRRHRLITADERDHLRVETEAAPQLPKQADVAGAILAEPEVLTDHHHTGA